MSSTDPRIPALDTLRGLAVLLVIGAITGSAIGLTIAIAKGIWREIKNDKNNKNIAGNVNSGSLGTAT